MNLKEDQRVSVFWLCYSIDWRGSGWFDFPDCVTDHKVPSFSFPTFAHSTLTSHLTLTTQLPDTVPYCGANKAEIANGTKQKSEECGVFNGLTDLFAIPSTLSSILTL
jgi:hypothetical protein